MARLRTSILIIALLLIVAELAARAAIDIKIYGSDSEVGYWLLPNQSGGSLLTGSYEINSDGFAASKPLELTAPNDVILIGDSLVMGTSGLNQNERLGPILQKQTGWKVWPLTAGSWALANQLRMIGRKSVDDAEAIVFILNAADFEQPSQWQSEYQTPRSEPRSYLLYSIRKMFSFLRGPDKPVPVRPGILETEWRSFQANLKVPVLVVGYESAKTTGEGCVWLPAWLDARTVCFDPIKNGDSRYMIDPIHLSAEGNEILARLIQKNLRE